MLPSDPINISAECQADGSSLIIGAGPAGLTAALELTHAGVQTTVLESSSMPGGLSRTENYKGYRVDIGGHRFFTKLKIVEDIWHELLGPEFVPRPRLSRIYYNGKFFKYPLEPMDALSQLGMWETVACAASFVWARIFPIRPERTLDAWVSNRFGARLFRTFFKGYTEKVWGIPCSQIDADWAAQRIQGLNAISLLKNMFSRKPKDKSRVLKTLIDSFHYPRLGPGMMWDACAKRVKEQGGTLIFNAPVVKVNWEPGRVTSISAADGAHFRASHYISTMPVREFIQALDPPAPIAVLDAAARLQYRDFLTVALIVNRAQVFPDNWIYIHDSAVKVGRIQNFKNWSPEMVPSQETTCLGLEYFCAEGDGLWSLDDQELIRMAARELRQLGIAAESDCLDGAVLRAPKAYPVYDGTYKVCLQTIRAFLPTLANLQFVGRNGMHHYNNQDHSMLTGLLAARNILGADYDLWKINADPEYHESGALQGIERLAELRSSQPKVPRRVAPSVLKSTLVKT